MRLILADARLSHSWSGPWMYLGRDYLRMRAWKRRLPGLQISLSALIGAEAAAQRPKILEWLSRMRDANGDSLSWWMSHLACRNNTASQFFIYLVQIAALKRWAVDNARSGGDVLVLCDDSFLLRAAAQNLGAGTRSKTGWELGWLRDVAQAAARFLSALFSQMLSFARHSWIARRTRPHALEMPRGEVFLLHQCLDDARLAAQGRLTCRYFTVLPDWLEGKGKQVVALPWLCSVSLPLDAVYSRLRAANCLIVHDWVTARDYLRALGRGLMGFTAFGNPVVFDGIDVRHLVTRERLQQLSQSWSFAQFWLYAPALRRWGASVTSLVMVDPYEAMPPERVQAYSWRASMGVPSKFIGYCHSLVSADFLGFHTPPGDAQSLSFPDLVVTSGSLGRDLLVSQGMPPERVRSGPALRQLARDDGGLNGAGARHCLVLLVSLIPDATVELLEKMSDLSTFIRDELRVPVVVKGHPMMSDASVLQLIGWSALPEGWSWHRGDLPSALRQAVCAVTLSTASLTDAILAGCIPCCLARALDTPWNGLDFLADKYPVLHAVPDEDIQFRLKEIFISRRSELYSQTLQVRDELLRGLNPVNDETMAAFV